MEEGNIQGNHALYRIMEQLLEIDNIEGVVTKTGKSMMITDCENDPRYTYTVVDDQDLKSVGGLNQCKLKWSKVKSIKILSGEINPDEAR